MPRSMVETLPTLIIITSLAFVTSYPIPAVFYAHVTTTVTMASAHHADSENDPYQLLPACIIMYCM
jgi:hypothetical protein